MNHWWTKWLYSYQVDTKSNVLCSGLEANTSSARERHQTPTGHLCLGTFKEISNKVFSQYFICLWHAVVGGLEGEFDVFGCSCNNGRKIHFWTVKDICSPWPPKARVQAEVSFLCSSPCLLPPPLSCLALGWHSPRIVCVSLFVRTHVCLYETFLSMVQELRAVTHFLPEARTLRSRKRSRRRWRRREVDPLLEILFKNAWKVHR